MVLPTWSHVLLNDDAPLVERVSRVPPEHRVPNYLARRFSQICSGVMSELWAAEGLLRFEFACMVSIAAAPGLDQTRLAEELGIDRTNTGQVIDGLEAKGLVERRSDPADRRIRRLFLTSKGRTLRRRLDAAALAAQDRILEPLNDEEKVTLLRLLLRVVEANKAYARPGAGRRPPQPGRRRHPDEPAAP
jgi:DNA-binding MarR family transcriptional regulator